PAPHPPPLHDALPISSWAPASATATTTAAQPKVSAIISVTVATTLRRRVQKGMEERQQGKAVEGRGLKAEPVVELHQEHVGRGIEKHLVTEIMCEVERGVEQIDEPRPRAPATTSLTSGRLKYPGKVRRSGFGQKLLEERQGARVAGLAEPEQRLAPHARLRVSSGDPDEGGDAGVVRLLRQGEDRLLLHVPVEVAIAYQVGQVCRSGVAGSLSEPAHRLAPR